MEEDSESSKEKKKNEKKGSELEELLLSDAPLARASQYAMLMPGYTNVLSSMALFQQAIVAAAATQQSVSASSPSKTSSKQQSSHASPSPSRSSRPRKRVAEGCSSLPGLPGLPGLLSINSLHHQHQHHLQTHSELLVNDPLLPNYYEEQSFPESHPGKTCAFCNLSERSLLGQGELVRIKLGDVKACTEPMSPKSSPLIKKKLKISTTALEDLEGVGYPEEKDAGRLREMSTGHVFVHLNCALWSSGVLRSKKEEGQNGLLGVENTLKTALSTACVYCKRFGASLKCASGSGASYHWPCAVASGCYMNKSKLLIVGTDSLGEVAKLAENQTYLYHNGETWKYGRVAELKVDKFENLLCCTVCGQHYFYTGKHVLITPAIRGGWQCQKCKWCQNCRKSNQEDRYVLCDVCDGAFHAHCLKPPVPVLPKNGWKCKKCRKCSDCKMRTNVSRWHGNFSVCDPCYQLRNKGISCPVCKRAYRNASQKDLMQCSKCRRQVHVQCDQDGIEQSLIEKKGFYVCKACKSGHRSSSLGSASSISGGSSPISEEFLDDEFFEGGGRSSSLGKGKPLSALSSSKKRKFSSSSSSSMGLLGSSQTHRSSSSPTVSSLLKGQFPSWKVSSSSSTSLTGGVGGGSTGPGLSGTGDTKKRNASTTEVLRKGRQPPKIRGMVGLQRPTAEPGVKIEDVEEENKMICTGVNDHFVLEQDICVMCGSLGNDSEGRLIVCSQCGQCYHPHCVNVRLTKVILEKGWRCLDCTVCEGCGRKHDEGNLILCDECDISYHIYCMDPPLDRVPSGTWKCKWCAICIACGANTPGVNSPWYENYSLCGPCHSLQECLLCEDGYEEGELIMKCSHCLRWSHGECDSIQSEKDAEKCAEEGYKCQMCRPSDILPPHLAAHALPSDTNQLDSKQAFSSPSDAVSPDFSSFSCASFVMDGVVLSERGMGALKAQTVEKEKIKRKRRGDRNAFEGGGDSVGGAPGVDYDDDDDDLMPAPPTPAIGSHKDGDRVYPLANGNPPPAPDGFSVVVKENGIMILRKRRHRDLKKVGIGGFLAKSRSSKCNKSKEEGSETPEATNGDKPKRRPPWRPKKNKILVQYPDYIQDSFFGKDFISCKGELDLESPCELMNDVSIKEEVEKDMDFNDFFLEKQRLAESTLTLGKEVFAAMKELKAREEEEAQRLIEEEKELADKEKSSTEELPGADRIKKESDPTEKSLSECGDKIEDKVEKPKESSDQDGGKEISKADAEEIDQEVFNGDFNLDDTDLLPNDLFPDEMFSSLMDDDDDPSSGGGMDGNGKEMADKKIKDEEKDSKKGDAALAAALQDTLGPGFKLDSRDMDDIFKDMIDEGDSKEDNHQGDEKGESSSGPESKKDEVPRPPSTMVKVEELKPILETNSVISNSNAVSECSTIPSSVCSQPLPNQNPPLSSVMQPNLSHDKSPLVNQDQTPPPQQQTVLHTQAGLNVSAQRQPLVINQQPPQLLQQQQTTQQIIQPQQQQQQQLQSIQPQQLMMLQQNRPQIITQRPIMTSNNQQQLLQQQQQQQQQQIHQQQLLQQQQQQIRLQQQQQQQQQQLAPPIARPPSFSHSQQQIPLQTSPRFPSAPSPYHQPDYSSNSPQLPSPSISSEGSWSGPNARNSFPKMPSVASSPTPPSPQVEIPPPQSNQKAQLMKWESDEPLGDQATIAMILYANKNHPNLKAEFPQWSDRIKQIAKIWKNLPNEKRHHYVQTARENRTANRMNRSCKKNVASSRVPSSSPSTPSSSSLGSAASSPSTSVISPGNFTGPIQLPKAPTPPMNQELHWKKMQQQQQHLQQQQQHKVEDHQRPQVNGESPGPGNESFGESSFVGGATSTIAASTSDSVTVCGPFSNVSCSNDTAPRSGTQVVISGSPPTLPTSQLQARLLQQPQQPQQQSSSLANSEQLRYLLQREKPPPASGVTTSRVWVPEPGLPRNHHPNIQFRQPLPPRPGMRVITPHHFYPNAASPQQHQQQHQIEQRSRMVSGTLPQVVSQQTLLNPPPPSQQQHPHPPEFVTQQSKMALQQQQQPLLQSSNSSNISPNVSQSSPLLAQQLAGAGGAQALKKPEDPSKIQEAPPLEKIDQEELGDLGVGEDDLLGMGDDFNILEFADALEEGDNNQTTIWDTIKEDEESKEAAAIAQGSPPSSEAEPLSSIQATNSSSSTSINNQKQQSNKAEPLPPPYRGPPPPYPGVLGSNAPKEQPLLLEDLLEQEKREQLQQQPQKSENISFPPGEQGGNPGAGGVIHHPTRMMSPSQAPKQHQTMVRPQVVPNNVVVGGGGGQVATPNFRGMRPPQSPQPQQPQQQRWPVRHPQEITLQQRTVMPGQLQQQQQMDPRSMEGPIPHQQHPALINSTEGLTPPPVVNATPPPQPPDDPKTEEERQKAVRYEQWLNQQEQSINQQLKYYETEITKLRKQRKSLNSKQRTMRKSGNSLNVSDQGELNRVNQGAAEIQKTLERIRKQSRQHSTIMNDYKSRKQRVLQQQQLQQQQQQQQHMAMQQQQQQHSMGGIQQMAQGGAQISVEQQHPQHQSIVVQQHPQRIHLQQQQQPSMIHIQRPNLINATQLRMQQAGPQQQQVLTPQQRMVLMQQQQQRQRGVLQQQQQQQQAQAHIIRVQNQHLPSPQTVGEMSPAVSSNGGQSPLTSQPSPHSLNGQPSPQSFGAPSPGQAVRPGMTSPMPSPGGMSPMRVPSQSPQPSMPASPAYHHSGYPSSQSPHGPSPRSTGHDDNPFSPNAMQRPLNTISPVSLTNSPSPVSSNVISPQSAVRIGSPQPVMRPPAMEQRLRFVRPVSLAQDMRPPMRGAVPVSYQQQHRMIMRQPVSPSHQAVRSPQPMMVQQRRPSSSTPSPVIDRPLTPQTPRTPGHTPSPQHEMHSDQYQMHQQQLMQQQQQQQQHQMLLVQQNNSNNLNNTSHQSGWSGDPNMGLKGGRQIPHYMRGWGPFIGLKGGSPIFTQSSDVNTVTTASSTVATSSDPQKVIVMTSSGAQRIVMTESTSLSQASLQIITSDNSIPSCSAPLTQQTVQRLIPSSSSPSVGVPGAFASRSTSRHNSGTKSSNPIQTVVINGPSRYTSIHESKSCPPLGLPSSGQYEASSSRTSFVISPAATKSNSTTTISITSSKVDFQNAVRDVKATLNLPCPVTITDVLTQPTTSSSTITSTTTQSVMSTSVLQGGPPRMASSTISTSSAAPSLLSTVLSTNKPIRSSADISAIKTSEGSSSPTLSSPPNAIPSNRPNALLKQLLSSNSHPSSNSGDGSLTTSSSALQDPPNLVTSQLQVINSSSSTPSVKTTSNALEAQLDKPTLDPKFSQLPIPKRSLSSLASQIPQPTPLSTPVIATSEPKTVVSSTVIQLQKNNVLVGSTTPPLSLPTQPVPQASLPSQSSNNTTTVMAASQQHPKSSFAMLNAAKPPNVTIIQNQQAPTTSMISITQSSSQKGGETSNSQVLQQRLLQRQILVPQNELSSLPVSASGVGATIASTSGGTMLTSTSSSLSEQSRPQSQPNVVISSMDGGISQIASFQSRHDIPNSQGAQKSMIRTNTVMAQQQQQIRTPLSSSPNEGIQNNKRPEALNAVGNIRPSAAPSPVSQQQRTQFVSQVPQRPPCSPSRGNLRPQLEGMKHQGLRLQIPPPNQQVPPQQPSPALTPKSDGGVEDANDGNSSKGDNSFDSSTSAPDFANGLDPPQKAATKRRPSQQQKRRQSGGNKDGAAKKRARKGSKAEETDYDSYMESLLHQLKSLPPVPAVEPMLSHCYNACPIYGMGELPKTFGLDIDTRLGGFISDGTFGEGNLKSEGDYYNTMPFGNDPPIPYIPSVKITSRGFYKQEFENAKNRNMDSDGIVLAPQSPDLFYSSSPEPDCDQQTAGEIEAEQNKIKKNISWRNSMMNGSHDKIWFDLDPDDSEEEAEKICQMDSRPKSPSVDVVHPIPIRPKSGQPLCIKVENNKNIELDSVAASKLQSFLPSKNGGSFKAVTLTLSAKNGSAKNILKALNGLAKLLKIETPKQWLAEDMKHGPRDVFRVKGEGDKDLNPMDLQSVIVEGAPFCNNCEVVVLRDMVKIPTDELSFLSKSEKNDAGPELFFCNSKCYFQFAAARTKEINGDVNSLEELIELKNKRKEDELEKKAKKETPEVDKGPKYKGTFYKTWNLHEALTRKYKQLTENELMQMMFKMGVTIMPPRETDDTRVCLFCHIRGDAASDGPARLLNYDVDKWVHLNCALWSEEVYETVSGALVNVETALKNGVNLYCKVCEKNGATVKCFKARCSNYYHVGCASKDRTMFYKNKSVYCSQHIPKGEKDQELTTLAVYRRVFIDRDENRLAAKVMDTSDNDSYLMRIGSMIFLSVGQLLPHQLHNFHTKDFIYPIGYKIIRYYWSMVNLNKRTAYTCSIAEVNNKPEFHISVGEEVDGEMNKTFKGSTAKAVWMQILERVDKLRRDNDLVKVFPQYISGEDLFGLTETNVIKVLESLPGIESLTDYNFKYGRNPLLELPLAVNPSGCARLEPQMRTRVKRVHNFQRTTSTVTPSLSRAAKEMVPTLIGLETTGPYSKNFVQSKSSQYRKMKMEWRQNVVLARSGIQGLGLYAARDLEKHQMIIEYIGEIIRSELTDIREKYYESQNRGIYMFRLDDDRVLDATMCGGMARYINHSCDPSCVTETVEVDKDFHIIIFANRRISRGEELSYDYKFDYEDDNRIPCLCGAANCRKWMN